MDCYTSATFAFEVLFSHRTIAFYLGGTDPTAADIDAVRLLPDATKTYRVMAVSDGGIPTLQQQHRLREYGAHSQALVVVISPSSSMPFITSALSIAGTTTIRAFLPHEYDQAMAYLRLTSDEPTAGTATVARLRRLVESMRASGEAGEVSCDLPPMSCSTR